MIKIGEIHVFRSELCTRLPFRYGIATMTELPHVFIRARIEIDGKSQVGISADHLPPKWFTKDPSRDPREEIADMLAVIRQATGCAAGMTGRTVFALWRQIYAAQAAWARARQIPPLLAHFGTSLVERAVIDAWCRARGEPFHRLLTAGDLGMELGELSPDLAGSSPSDWLPAAPLSSVWIRHTVGLADPITTDDIAPGERLTDGLPQALDECIRRYGLCHFKLKLSGQRDADFERLEAIAAVLAKCAPANLACSLDGNEAFPSFESFHDFFVALFSRPRLAELRRHLSFVEQPLHRRVALHPAAGSLASLGPDFPPVIIDESDGELESLPIALRMGYAGTSHKNCKGVFKGILNACRIAQQKRLNPGSRFLMTGEDLSNIGPVALLQDLAVQATLGIESVERNGHHYFAGLSFWPEMLQRQMVAHHDDLYAFTPAGWPSLRVTGGRASVRSINAAPFGLGFLPDVASFASVTSA